MPEQMLKEQKNTKNSLTLASENVDLEILKEIKSDLTLKEEENFFTNLLHASLIASGTPYFMVKIFINTLQNLF